jgi:hypothetical protein
MTQAPSTPPYNLDQWVWTTADFERMGWHDATIHALAFAPDTFEILFDLDYILQWIHRTPPERYFSFWIAPATLVFENVSDVRIEITNRYLTLQDIQRSDEQTTPSGLAQWLWTLNGNEGTISLRSTGFVQYFRRVPICTASQQLPLAQRGISVERGRTDQAVRLPKVKS